ncbi:MAG: sulfatase, partial [Fuerstia sp.]|nr:sulfatase [Fuerstiella sp.]
MNSKLTRLQHQTRRHFLSSSGIGLGAIALSSLNGGLARADIPIDPTTPLEGRKPHFDAKAKRAIYLHLTGSPPNLDIYDY